ncbi:MAG TPA: hypothetical protein PK109_03205 [Candidatus Paceibacterota bacterium]|nr:hypothetical protein [Candidatus Paceibacterota bacterium]
MTIKKFLAGSVLALALLAVAPTTHAATSTSVQAQINLLLQMIAQLQTQLTALGGESVSGGTPTCTLTATPAAGELNDKVRVSWTSSNATKLSWVKDTSGKDTLKVPTGNPKLSGSKNVKMTVLGNPKLTMKATGKDGTTSTCSVTIPVTEGDSDEDSSDDKPVSCLLWADKTSYEYGDDITYSWSSRNASSAGWVIDTSGKDTLALPGDKLEANGTQSVKASVIGNPTVTLKVRGSDGNGSCSTKVNITE